MTLRAAHGLRRSALALWLAAWGLPLLLSGCSREVDATLFEDATAASGLDAYRGMTHGAAWGDFDGDGRPDVYVGNHLNAAALWRNLGDGRFQDVSAQWLAPQALAGDKHGAAWADFDRDGRLDLVQLTGADRGVGVEPKRLLNNTGTALSDVAVAQGVHNPEGRTRTPLWLDLNGDGRLDLFQGAEGRLDDKTPPFTFLQQGAGFVAADAWLPLPRSVPFCLLAELTGDDRAELLCRLVGHGGAVKAFVLGNQPAEVRDLLPQVGFEDAAVADFDNDGRLDLLLSRKNAPGAVALAQPAPQRLVASVALDTRSAALPAGFDVRASGPIRVRVSTVSVVGDAVTPARIWLGNGERHPPALEFPVGTDIGALAAAAPGSQAGVYIGFTAPNLWQVRVTAPQAALAGGRPRVQEVQVSVESATGGPLADPQPVGETADESAPLRLFMNRGDNRLVEESDARGLNRRLVSGVNVVAGDFDNDMDTDIFVLASGDVARQGNLLLLNDGKGNFRMVKNAGGVAGGLAGVGDSATLADVDGDGFLDLFLALGGSMGRSLGLPSDAGSYRLYRNRGAGTPARQWIAIDLEGVQSNSDAIGAVVRVTADGVTQTRLQGGGVHNRGQNHARLHFGLAQNTLVQKISVRWPSGRTQELSNVAAGQVLKVREQP